MSITFSKSHYVIILEPVFDAQVTGLVTAVVKPIQTYRHSRCL